MIEHVCAVGVSCRMHCLPWDSGADDKPALSWECRRCGGRWLVPPGNVDAVRERDARIAELQAEVSRLRGLIDRDRTGLAEGLSAVLRLVDGWAWLGRRGEWGCYELPQQSVTTLRQEIGRCLEAIAQTADTALRESGRRASLAFDPAKEKE